MRRDRKKAAAIVLTSMVVAAGIIVPLALIYPKQQRSAENVTIVDLTGKEGVTMTWGDDPNGLPAPDLPEGDDRFNPKDYGPGVFNVINPTGFKGPTKSGDKTTITYDYAPTKNGPVVRAVYTLTIVRKKPTKRFGANGDGKETDTETVAYSSALPTTIKGDTPAQWITKNQYVGYEVKSEIPTYRKEDGTPLATVEYQQLNAGQSFVAEYEFKLDTEHYETTIKVADPADPTKQIEAQVPTTAKLTVTYTIVPFELAEVPSVNQQQIIEYGSPFGLPVLPQDAKKEHYEPLIPQNWPALSVVTKPTGATQTPDAGQSFKEEDVSKYESGTVIKVAYAFTPVKPNYKGKEYSYVYTYEITNKRASPPEQLYSEIRAEFGKFNQAQAPVPPGYEGYVGTLKSAIVTAQSDSPEVTNARYSPPKNAGVVWADINKYNPRTEFEARFEYKSAPNYSAAPFELVWKYIVTTTKVDVPDNVDNPAVDDKTYGAGSDPTLIPPPAPKPGFIVGKPIYYDGPDSTGNPIDEDVLKGKPPGTVFTVKWPLKLDDKNFSPKDDQSGDTYTVTNHYKAAPKTAEYFGKKDYDGVSIEYGQPAPFDFTPNTVPETAKNTGYVYDRVEYAIDSAPSGATPASGVEIGNLSSVNTYAAGTIVVARVWFKAGSGYAGDPFYATKKLTITPSKKADVQPTNKNFGNVNIPYGSDYGTPMVPRSYVGYKAGTLKTSVVTNPAKKGYPASTADPVIWSDVKTYGAETVITVTWSYVADSNYEGTTSFEATQTFTIIGTPATATAQDKVDETSQSYTYGSIAPGEMPTAANVPKKGTGYQGSLVSVKISKKSFVQGDADSAPDTGTDVTNWSKTAAFNAGTEFTVTWRYEAEPNYTGDSFEIRKTYVVTKQIVPVVPPAVLDKKTHEYGKYGATMPPVPPSYVGYLPSYVSSTIKTASSTSPPVNALAEWSDFDKYGAGTVVTVTFKYEIPSQSNYQPPANGSMVVNSLQDHEVVPAEVAVPTDATEPNDQNSYKYLEEPGPLKPTGQDGKFVLSDTNYYVGPQQPPTSAPVKPEDIKKLNAGDVFTVVWTYKPAAPNYKPKTPGKDSYTVTKSYTVGARQTSYNGKTSYPAATTPFGAGLPAGFVPDKLPDGDANNNYYAYGTTTYIVDTEANDKSGPKKNQTVNGVDISKLGAGTKLIASITFLPIANYVGTPPVVTTTKLLEITRAQAVAPASGSAFVDPQMRAYGTGFMKPSFSGLPVTDQKKFTGYSIGSYESATITKIATLAAGNTGPVIPSTTKAMTDADWADTNTYWAETEITVQWKYVLDTDNYTSTTNEFLATQLLSITQAEVQIPQNSTLSADSTTYRKGDQISVISAPVAQDKFRLVSTAFYDAADGSGATLTEQQIKDKLFGQVFYARWTFELINQNYKPQAPSTSRSYMLTKPYTVAKQTASYSGSLVYVPKDIAYKQSVPANFLPTILPEGDANNNGYEVATITYRITKKSYDNRPPQLGTIDNLDMINTYGAGKEITVTITFRPKDGYEGKPVVTTMLIKIARGQAVLPKEANTTLPDGSWTYRDNLFTPNGPIYATGFTSGLPESKFSALSQEPGAEPTPDKLGMDANLSNSNTFWVGTVIEFKWRYDLDKDNYTAPADFFYITQHFKVTPKEITILPDQGNPTKVREINKGSDLSNPSVVEAPPLTPYLRGDYEGPTAEYYGTRDGTGPLLTVEQINSKNSGEFFSIKFIFKLKSDYNYKPANNDTRTGFYILQLYKFK